MAWPRGRSVQAARPTHTDDTTQPGRGGKRGQVGKGDGGGGGCFRRGGSRRHFPRPRAAAPLFVPYLFARLLRESESSVAPGCKALSRPQIRSRALVRARVAHARLGIQRAMGRCAGRWDPPPLRQGHARRDSATRAGSYVVVVLGQPPRMAVCPTATAGDCRPSPPFPLRQAHPAAWGRAYSGSA